METQAQAKQLWFHYTDENGERTSPDILKDISLSIDKGDFVALLGHNGSGKSTFAKHMNAILLPSAGTMTVDGIDTKDESQRFTLRSHVGMVFQNPDNQIVATIVEEDVAFGPENLGIPPQEIRERVDDALKAVEMYDYREHAPSQLSGGQKQRLSIARAIAKKPEIFIFDDSFSALDLKTDAALRRALAKKVADKTVIIVAQRISTILHADQILVLNDGRIVGKGTHEELLRGCETYREIARSQMSAKELGMEEQEVSVNE